MTFDVLRHGETGICGTCAGSTDVALSARGWAQMRNATQRGGPWDAIVSSPLRRCAEFAREFSARASLPLTLDARWRELRFSAREGRAAGELRADALAHFWSNPWGASPPRGGESLPCLEARVPDARGELIEHGTAMRVLIVTHGGVIGILLGHARRVPRADVLKENVPHASSHRIASGPLA
jgi:alpha-ribazole phosphatase